MREDIERAWASSFLTELPPAAADELLASAHEQELISGQNVYRELAEPRFAFVGLLTAGMLRIYITSPGGRRAALRYVRPGEVIGLTAMIRGGGPAGAEAVTAGSLLRFDPVTFRRLAQTDPSVCWAVTNELAREISLVGGARLQSLFGSVRVRVAWHLAELIVERGERLTVRVTQQDLADSVGSVREVVARVLAQLRDEGIIDRDGSAIVVKDRDRLTKIAQTVDG
jgi:CRP-like cAMP-binding protein